MSPCSRACAIAVAPHVASNANASALHRTRVERREAKRRTTGTGWRRLTCSRGHSSPNRSSETHANFCSSRSAGTGGASGRPAPCWSRRFSACTIGHSSRHERFVGREGSASAAARARAQHGHEPTRGTSPAGAVAQRERGCEASRRAHAAGAASAFHCKHVAPHRARSGPRRKVMKRWERTSSGRLLMRAPAATRASAAIRPSVLVQARAALLIGAAGNPSGARTNDDARPDGWMERRFLFFRAFLPEFGKALPSEKAPSYLPKFGKAGSASGPTLPNLGK